MLFYSDNLVELHQGDCREIMRGMYAESVQVSSREGSVMQASGPCNQRNKAVEYGRRALTKWGAGIRGKQTLGTSDCWGYR